MPATTSSFTSSNSISRRRLHVSGVVQGVGFRPFVFRLATSLQLTGQVANDAAGVIIDIEGAPAMLDAFQAMLLQEAPSLAAIHHLTVDALDVTGDLSFAIRESRGGAPHTCILPDISTCSECRREIFDPHDRRYRYPFTNCTNCGPRYTIIDALPYDRQATAMNAFHMCPACQAEYDDPRNRRFHAQPNACPDCGPQLSLLTGNGRQIASQHDAIYHAVEALHDGQIVALKGLGGFQLLVDASNSSAGHELRRRKHRPANPFAIMASDLAQARALCRVSDLASQVLCSPEAPIVLLQRRQTSSPRFASVLANDAIAPGLPTLGIMLAYTPLHHLLLHEFAGPVIATSGNISDDPLCIDNDEALEQLRDIADVFLIHDRPIRRQADDSVVQVVADRPVVLRRARGYAPLPITLPGDTDSAPTVLAVGGHLKNTVALAVGEHVFIAPHVGDLSSIAAMDAARQRCQDLLIFTDHRPDVVAHDLHPDYASTQHAMEITDASERIGVQHHAAHLFACLADNSLLPPAVGVCWDGTGFGTDGTIWGGEWLSLNLDGSFERLARLRTFRLPGGEVAVCEPRRSALGLLYEAYGDATPQLHSFDEGDQRVLMAMMRHATNSPLTSSMGRFFDAVAALVGLRQHVAYEGQAAIELEAACQGTLDVSEPYAFRIDQGTQPWTVDWQPVLDALLIDIRTQVPTPVIARRFHLALCDLVVHLAELLKLPRLVISGGCFQNALLVDRIVHDLRTAGIEPIWHQQVPPNDGGISLGQATAARLRLRALSHTRED